MRALDGELVTLLQARRGLVVRLLLWVTARNRSTGAAETMGLCSDVAPVTVTVDGASRTYLAAGGLLRAEPIVAEAGPVVRLQTVTMSGIAPEIDLLLRGYDPRLAPAELHQIVLDPWTGVAAGPPLRLFRGVVAEAPITTPEKGGSVSVSLTLAASARELTRGLALKFSDESQKRRSGDRLLQYADVSGEVGVWWGAVRYVPVTAAPATGPAPPRTQPEGSGFQ